MNSLDNIIQLLSINNDILNICIARVEEINKLLLYSGKPKGYKSFNSYLDADNIRGSRGELHTDIIDTLLEERGIALSIIDSQKKIIKELLQRKKLIESMYKNSNDIEGKIIYLKSQNKSLKQIARELGYSYQYIRRLYSEMLRKQ